MSNTLKKVAWFAILLGTLLFFLGAATAFSLNFTGVWQPNTWRLTTDQSALSQVLIFLLFNSDFWGVILAVLGVVLFSVGVLVLNEHRIGLALLKPISIVFLGLSVVTGGSLLFFSQFLFEDSPFRFVTPSINKGVLGIFGVLGFFSLFVLAVPWLILLYFLRRNTPKEDL